LFLTNQLIFLFDPVAPRRSMVSVRRSVSRLARPLMGISDRSSGPCKFRTGVCASFFIGRLYFLQRSCPGTILSVTY